MAISNGPTKRFELKLPEIPSRSTKIISSPTIAAIGPDGTLSVSQRENDINPRRQPPSRPRGSSEKGSRSEDTIKLPIDASNRASEPAKEESPAIILQDLMNKFIFLKENGGKAEAFKQLQKSLATHAAVLCPYFIPFKDLTNLLMELETYIGKSGEHIGKTPEQVIRGFLQTGFVNDSKIPSPYDDNKKTVDKLS
jgi:hypothetical protein